MWFNKFWSQLSAASKVSFVVCTVVLLGLISLGAYWLLRADYEPVLHATNTDRLAAGVREIERLKIPYRVDMDGTTIEVPHEFVGRARLGLGTDPSVGGSGVGFELFNNTDFSTTEFTQKVNYQRALQGELARTISGIEGVASARVHLVLPESGFLRRQSVRPTAAVTISTQDGQALSAAQVLGIQKLIAASVPDIKLSDISVIDHEGVALTRGGPGADEDGNAGQLALKREIDSYLEAKLKHVLREVDPNAEFSVSVDASLNQDEVKVTTEDVLAAPEGDNLRRSGGLIVRERQTQRQEGAVSSTAQATTTVTPGNSTTKEVDYQVGRRVEQVVTRPGAIDRLSVAVVGRIASTGASDYDIKTLVQHAIGTSEQRGDSVAVVLLPPLHETVEPGSLSASAASGKDHAFGRGVGESMVKHADTSTVWGLGIVLLAVAAGTLFLWWSLASARTRGQTGSTLSNPRSEAEIAEITRRVRAWLDEGVTHGAN